MQLSAAVKEAAVSLLGRSAVVAVFLSKADG